HTDLHSFPTRRSSDLAPRASIRSSRCARSREFTELERRTQGIAFPGSCVVSRYSPAVSHVVKCISAFRYVLAALPTLLGLSAHADAQRSPGQSMSVGRSPGRDDPAMKEIGPELELRLANGVNITIAHAT